MADINQKEEIWVDTVNKITWKQEHLTVMKKIHFDYDINGELTDEQWADVIEKVIDYFQMHGIGGRDTVTPTGRICEKIVISTMRLDNQSAL